MFTNKPQSILTSKKNNAKSEKRSNGQTRNSLSFNSAEKRACYINIGGVTMPLNK